MEAVVSRLERVAERLEKLEGAPRPSPATTAPTSVGAAPAPSSSPPASASGANALSAYDQFLTQHVAPFVLQSQALGADVTTAVGHLDAGFKGIRTVIESARKTTRPDDAGLQALVGTVASAMSAATGLTEGRRTAAFNHFKVIAECMQALSWIVYSGPACGMTPPSQFVAEAAQSSEFYANRIVMEFKGKDDAHVVWVRKLKELMVGMEEFVRLNCSAGLPWNTAGASAAAPAAAGKPAAPPGRAPPPPPPPGKGPPPPPSLDELAGRRPAGATSSAAGNKASSSAPDTGALFKELQKGEGITSGLKKVTDDMKSKNRADRTGVVSTSSSVNNNGGSRPGAAPGAKAPAGGTPRLELQDKKWVVEHQRGAKDLVIDVTNPAHSAYVFGCHDCVLQVKGKINAITLDGCTKLGLVFEEVIASCELVNCSKVQVQCTGKVATVAVEKSDGCQLYIPAQVAAEHPDFQVVTAKCSEVNVIVVPATDDADSQEHAVPEQFISTFKGGQLVTVAVAHSGA